MANRKNLNLKIFSFLLLAIPQWLLAIRIVAQKLLPAMNAGLMGKSLISVLIALRTTCYGVSMAYLHFLFGERFPARSIFARCNCFDFCVSAKMVRTMM